MKDQTLVVVRVKRLGRVFARYIAVHSATRAPSNKIKRFMVRVAGGRCSGASSCGQRAVLRCLVRRVDVALPLHVFTVPVARPRPTSLETCAAHCCCAARNPTRGSKQAHGVAGDGHGTPWKGAHLASPRLSSPRQLLLRALAHLDLRARVRVSALRSWSRRVGCPEALPCREGCRPEGRSSPRRRRSQRRRRRTARSRPRCQSCWSKASWEQEASGSRPEVRCCSAVQLSVRTTASGRSTTRRARGVLQLEQHAQVACCGGRRSAAALHS